MPKLVSRITSQPTVGEEYYVPCVEYGGFWVPVIGPPHTDVHLGQPKKHWHVDLRFITEPEMRDIVETPLQKCYPPADHDPVPPSTNFNVAIIVACKQQQLQKQLRVCLREFPDMSHNRPLKCGATFQFVVGPLQGVGKIEDEVEGKTLTGKCLSCPHRGLHLRGVKPKNGIITCPGHALDFDARTHKLVRRTVNRNGVYYHSK